MPEPWVLEGGKDDGDSFVIGPFDSEEEARAFGERADSICVAFGGHRNGFSWTAVRMTHPDEIRTALSVASPSTEQTQ